MREWRSRLANGCNQGRRESIKSQTCSCLAGEIVPLSQKLWMTSVVAVCGVTRFIIQTRVWILKWSNQRECRSGNRGIEGDVRGTIRFARSDLCCCARSHYNYTRGAPRGHGGVRLARAKMFILEQLFITRAVREKSYQPGTRQRNII